MFIKLQDLRYIRRTPGEVAVLRELVSFQRCRVICPSEFWLAQMTNYEERQVRRILGKLRASELIGYDKHSKDFRGPNRPTNTYTLKPENIQRLIDAGKVVVAKALETYYDKRSVPKHNKKAPVKMSGHSQEQPVKMSGQTTGQDVPQDVSLSIENLHPDKDGDYEPPHEEFDGEGSTEPSWEDLREMEALRNNDADSNINPCLQSSSEDLPVSDLKDGISEDTNKSTLPPPTMPEFVYSHCRDNGIVYKVTVVDGMPVGQTFDHYYGSKPGELGLKH